MFNIILDEVTNKDGHVYTQVPAQSLSELGFSAEEIAQLLQEYEDKKAAEQEKTAARSFLGSTDWKVIRHADEVALGVATSLTEEQYQQLLALRRTARAKA